MLGNYWKITEFTSMLLRNLKIVHRESLFGHLSKQYESKQEDPDLVG